MPMKPGTTAGEIKTPMMDANVQRKNTPKTHEFKGMPSKSGDSGMIKSPMNQLKK